MVSNLAQHSGSMTGSWQKCLSSAAMLCLLAISAVSQAEALRPFDVRASIEMPRIISPADGGMEGPALFSPTREQFLVHVRRGVVDLNQVEDTILVFESAKVRVYFQGRTADRPPPQRLLTIRARTEAGRLRNLAWVDARHVAFIAEDRGSVAQVFEIDVRSLVVTQRTNSPTGVAAFSTNRGGVLYYDHAPLPEVPVAQSVTGSRIADIVQPDRLEDMPLRLWWKSGTSEAVPMAGSVHVRLMDSARKLWLSPDGRRAILLWPAVNASPDWARYNVPNPEVFGFAAPPETDPASRNLLLRTRYMILNTEDGAIRPLIDAPTGWLSQNATPAKVFWRSDSQSAVISNTFVPEEVGKVGGRPDLWREHPAIVDADVAQSQIRVVAWEPAVVDGKLRQRIISIAFDENADTLALIRRDEEKLSHQSYRKSGGRWSSTSAATKQDLEVYRAETVSARERLSVRMAGESRSLELYDPLSSQSGFTFGQSRLVSFNDRNGISWRALLILPTSYIGGRSYPAVLQTHGLRQDQFLTDGPGGITTAMAAQPLANSGFVVLQIEDNREASTGDQAEASRFVEGYRAATEWLTKNGYADRDRLGIIGFSRTGRHIYKLLADYPTLFRGAVISDSGWWGYMNQINQLNTSPDWVAQLRALDGPPPNSATIGEWVQRDPLFNMGAVSTAVRLEAIGSASALGMWEAHAALKKSKCAVDFDYFPEGSHVLAMPQQRYRSQGSSVDWFRFWLMDDESTEGPGQTERWRILRGGCQSRPIGSLDESGQHSDPHRDDALNASLVEGPVFEDAYSWLEPSRGTRALAWVEEQNQRTRSHFEAQRAFKRNFELANNLHAREPELAAANLRDTIFLNGAIYRVVKDIHHPRGQLRKSPADVFWAGRPVWQDVLDLDALSMREGRNWELALALTKCAPRSNRCLLYFWDSEGREKDRLREFDLGSQEFVSQGFSAIEPASNWIDTETLLVSFETAHGPVLKKWRRGKPIESAETISLSPTLGESTKHQEDVTLVPTPVLRDDSTQLMLVWEIRSDARFYRAMTPAGAVMTAIPSFSFICGYNSGRLIALLSRDGTLGGDNLRSGSIVALPESELTSPTPSYEVIYSPEPNEIVTDAVCTKSGVLALGAKTARGRATLIQKLNGSWVARQLDIPDFGSVRPVVSEADGDRVIFSFESFLIPRRLYSLSVGSGELKIFDSRAPDFDASAFSVQQFFARSKDGALVPYFVVGPKSSRMQPSPALLYAYGGFNIPVLPSYDGARGKLWLEQGGIFIIANIRGGGELGGAWYRSGKRTGRRNSYDDFIAVAEDAISRGFSSPGRIGAYGASNGGLLVGVMLNERPELFGAAIAEVALLDTFRLDLVGGPKSLGEQEIGSPDNPEERRFLSSTSPFQNLRAKAKMPIPLILTATGDKQVFPASPRRYAAKMSDLGLPYYYFESERGGHTPYADPAGHAYYDALFYSYLQERLMMTGDNAERP